MKEYKQPVIKTLELKADLEFAMVTSNPGGSIGSTVGIISGGNNRNSFYSGGDNIYLD